ncbi:MAG: HAMP domain-containing sensor histidine kinase [Campylobacterota bacterium]|nr:HAMP domain-containing sensor histidine kinase [Campylobacterota bacterium]
MKKLFIIILFSIFIYANDILVLNSYSPSLQWTQEQSSTIVKNLLKNNELKIYVEFMDTKVFKPSKINDENFLNYFKTKYRDVSFKAIVTTDDNALNFVRKHKNTLFKDSKVFFSGVNNLSLKNKLDKNIYAGVFEEKNPIENLEIAQKINKNLKTIYLIGDNSHTANKEIDHYKELLTPFTQYEFIYLNHNDIDMIIDSLKSYEQDSIMMLLVFTGFSKNKKHLSYTNALEELSKVYENPMFIHTNTYINTPHTHIVGGNCTDGKTSGYQAYEFLSRYINGEKMEYLGFSSKEGNKVYINVENLEKFDLTLEDLKLKNVVTVNNKKSFYEIYEEWIIVFTLISIMVNIFIFVLAKKNKVLRAYSANIEELNDSLEIKIQQALSKLKEQHVQHEQDTIKNTKFATIGQMAAGITHEINTPLTYIKGNIEMSRYDLEDMPDNQFKKQLLEDNNKVMNGIDRMAIIVESMREMSQITPIIRENTNIYATLITVLRMTYNRSKQVSNIYINGKHFELETSNKDELKYIANIHKQRIEQVWTIILNNAFDELVKVHKFDDRRIDINIKAIKNRVKVDINDNAGGVPDELLSKIFEPFVSTKESSGIGIGLNVAKKIIDEHDSSISVENKNGGACFTVIL